MLRLHSFEFTYGANSIYTNNTFVVQLLNIRVSVANRVPAPVHVEYTALDYLAGSSHCSNHGRDTEV
jgi:hypothetical protein